MSGTTGGIPEQARVLTARFASLPGFTQGDTLLVWIGVRMTTSVDRILEIVSREFPAAGIDCLLIGGVAVNQYGYTRNTLDVDFMILSERMDDVRRVLRDAGFTNMDIRENVAFFSVPDLAPRVDFLRVGDSTMRKLLANASRVTVRGYEIQIPSLLDLIAMKIFALTGDTARRMGKDLPDIAYLAVINNLDLESQIRPLCDRFGTSEVYRLIREQVEGLRAP